LEAGRFEMRNYKKILLTFDIEEFDLPLEYNPAISEKEQLAISKKGLLKILDLLNKHNIKATFFVTAKFALSNKRLIKMLSKKYEIAFHGFSHKDDYLNTRKDTLLRRLRKGKQVIENIIGKKVNGFRAPRFFRAKRFPFQKIMMLSDIGFKYDSSLHPTWIPGRYNNFFAERRIKKYRRIIEIPVSVTPVMRLPLFWLAFRNFGLGYTKFCTHLCFLDSSYVMLLFHPWEFIELNELNLKLPFYIKRNAGKLLYEKLYCYISWAKMKGYEFNTITSFLKKKRLFNQLTATLQNPVNGPIPLLHHEV
jgi:hypothetical protein